jgi:hypothetical protein
MPVIVRCACGVSTAQDHSGRPRIVEAHEQVTLPRFPVTVTRLPITRGRTCQHTVAYRPDNLTEVLTEHYRCDHPEALDLASREPTAETLR